MKAPSRTTSSPHYIVCPRCGSGELRPREPELASCDSCGLSVEGAVFRTLEQIATLPDASGAHACECGHPEMRRLPDGVFHCPACGSEVLPLKGRRSLPGDPLGSMGDSMIFPAGGAGEP
jgi:ribosomal protein L37AE/L43A